MYYSLLVTYRDIQNEILLVWKRSTIINVGGKWLISSKLKFIAVICSQWLALENIEMNKWNNMQLAWQMKPGATLSTASKK